VIARRRLLLRMAWAFGSTVAMVRAQLVPTVAPAPAVPPATMAALLASLSPWSSTASVHTGFGYKNNLLLSHAGEEGSGFARGGIEAFLWHLPRGRVDYFAMLNAEGTRYSSGSSVDHEAEAYAQAEWRYRIDDRFKFSIDLQGYYLDEIFDVSDTDVQRVVAQLKVSGVTVGPKVRWAFLPWAWIEAQGIGKRETYRDGLNNNHVGDGTVRLGWRPGERFEASFAGMERSRAFDSRSQYSVSGRQLDGTRLKIAEREAEFRSDITWDAAAHWKSTTRMGALTYRDNGSGYFNYHARKVEQSVDWTTDDWLVEVEGMARRLQFGVQTVGLGINPPARVKEEYSARCRIERKVSERWTIYGEFNWERSRCNDPIASYNMNEGLLGVRWSWEK
jgi:hypothetical protein